MSSLGILIFTDRFSTASLWTFEVRATIIVSSANVMIVFEVCAGMQLGPLRAVLRPHDRQWWSAGLVRAAADCGEESTGRAAVGPRQLDTTHLRVIRRRGQKEKNTLKGWCDETPVVMAAIFGITPPIVKHVTPKHSFTGEKNQFGLCLYNNMFACLRGSRAWKSKYLDLGVSDVLVKSLQIPKDEMELDSSPQKSHETVSGWIGFLLKWELTTRVEYLIFKLAVGITGLQENPLL